MPELIPVAPGSPEWLAARRAGVTATDIVTILGLSSWSSPYSLYWQKLGQVPETPDSDRFRLGRELEGYVSERWQEEHPATWVIFGGLYRNVARSWQLATTDCHVSDPADQQRLTGVLELKTWADADRHSWQDGPPATVRAQVLWQMDVMDVAAGHVGVVFLPSGEFRSYTLEHDHIIDARGVAHPPDDLEVCAVCADLELMRAAGLEFMRRLNLELPAPDPDSSAATLAAVRARFAKAPDKQAEIDAKLFEGWVASKEIVANDELFVRKFESLIREQAGEASVLTVDGQPVARRIISEAQVKAHTRRMDYLKRIKTEADSE